jgi:glycosyltransferase 2 family protein
VNFSDGSIAISRAVWPWVRLGGGAVILAVLVGRLGAGPFLDAFGLIGVRSLAAAVLITAFTTVCCAWRWGLVASALGVPVRWGPAVAAYYRSQLLNATLPAGVLGDVHRAVRHGRDLGSLGRGLRSVAWERALGQAVQVGLTVIVLVAAFAPRLTGVLPGTLSGVIAVSIALCLLALVVGVLPRPVSRLLRGAASDLRNVVVVRRALPGVVLASAAAAAGHVAIFLVAVRAAGVTASTGRLVVPVLIVLLASAVPTSIAGWGPREGAAAWAFGSAGLSAAQGVTVATVYGVMVLVAVLPGLAVLLSDRSRRPAPNRLMSEELVHV